MTKNIEIIAEIAQGFEGNPVQARLLVKGALAAGADGVKLQLVYADELCTPDYQYYDLFRSLEMDEAVWGEIAEMVRTAGKRLYFDVFGDASAAVARNVGADGVKLSTTEFYNQALQKCVYTTFSTVLLSIGGISIEEIDSFVDALTSVEAAKTTLMYGFQAEPTPLAHNNLRRLHRLVERYPTVRLGFMDHAAGDERDGLLLSLLTLGSGIVTLEKHITLDHLLQIEDSVSALTPSQFQQFVALVRRYETALGSDDLTLSAEETQYRLKAAKTAVAARALPAGSLVGPHDVALKRTGQQGSPGLINRIADVVGLTTIKGLVKDEPFFKEQLT